MYIWNIENQYDDIYLWPNLLSQARSSFELLQLHIYFSSFSLNSVFIAFKSPIILLRYCLFPPFRSLELFFATNQNNRGGEHINEKSPRLCRKFSSPPPLSIPSRTASPVRARKLSLHSPITARVGGLDLTSPLSNYSINHNTSHSAASSPTSAHTPQTPTPQTPTPTTSSPPPNSTSPPPNNSKSPQDQVPPIPSSPDQSPCPTAEGEELPRIDPFCGKLRRSIRRGKLKYTEH